MSSRARSDLCSIIESPLWIDMRELFRLRSSRLCLLFFINCLACWTSQPSFACANVSFDPRSVSLGYGEEALSNPVICGSDIMMDWASVEKTRGVLDFGPADVQARALSNANKKFVIVIRFSNEYPRDCSKPQNLPQWEVTSVPTLCDRGNGSVIPNYFDATFKKDFKSYVAKVAAHFEQSEFRSNILYARVAVGLGSEGFYLRPCKKGRWCDRETALTQMKEWGFSPSNWKDWQIEMLSFYKAAFYYTTVIYPLVALDVDPATKNPIQMDVALWAASKGIGLGALGLRPNFGRGPAQIAAIIGLVRSRYPKTFVQLQTFRPVASRAEAAEDLKIADALGANTIEWYSSDVSDLNLQDVFAQWAKRVSGR